MNTNVGKEYVVTDLQSIGIAVDNVDDISGLEMNSVISMNVTESPTPVATLSHSIAPSVAPSYYLKATHSSGHDSFPSPSPAMNKQQTTGCSGYAKQLIG